MSDMKISDSIVYVGANDKTIELFESQYPVPNGVSYNSYVILDEKVAVMDTVDPRATEEWFANLERVLAGRRVDYLVVSHMEPDHAGNVQKFAEKYPEAKIVGNAKTFGMMAQFFDFDVTDRKVEVKEGGTLELGSHTLQFFMAPMVHWPEVMVAYEQSEKILFSADGFGKFGATDVNEEWDDEAGRYFLNIVGKYGVQVQALLKKASGLDIRMICPLHGPILKENLGHYLGLYQTWSSYEPEKKGVLVAFASIHGNTAKASQLMAEYLRENGEADVTVMDLSRTDVSYAVRKAFYYDRIVLAGATYDGGVFPCMEEFLLHLKSKNYQKRTVGIIENGTWAPLAGKVMKGILETMKNITIAEPMVTIRSTVKEDTKEQMKELAKVLTA
ncbi:FprA family A-type flavoprotein [Brotaphodocola sp.]|uniref:FprA family A-type flavoprotein n=1 Tax=Brotaphodocola sp. TaxID=3073577 RepID=UPI003D7C6DED